eukprot:2058899-Rhodomonas_salina.1
MHAYALHTVFRTHGCRSYLRVCSEHLLASVSCTLLSLNPVSAMPAISSAHHTATLIAFE